MLWELSQNAGLTPFAFYNPIDVASGQQIGSNYDSQWATG